MSKIIEKPKQPKSVAQPNRRTNLLLGAMGLVVFIIAAFAAHKHTITGWELNVFNYVNGGSEGLLLLARIASDAVWAIVLLVAALFLVRKYFWSAWKIAVPAVLTYVTVFIMEIVVGRARPEVLLADTAILRAIQDGMGFPSGHVATITAIIVTVWPRLSNLLRVVAIVVILLVAWSRMYLGLHFPLDIIGGIAVGVSVACFIKILPDSWRKNLRLT